MIPIQAGYISPVTVTIMITMQAGYISPVTVTIMITMSVQCSVMVTVAVAVEVLGAITAVVMSQATIKGLRMVHTGTDLILNCNFPAFST